MKAVEGAQVGSQVPAAPCLYGFSSVITSESLESDGGQTEARANLFRTLGCDNGLSDSAFKWSEVYLDTRGMQGSC